MVRRTYHWTLVTLGLLAAVILSTAFFLVEDATLSPQDRLRVSEENPRYFKYKGKHVFLAGKTWGWTAISAPPPGLARDYKDDSASQYDYRHDIENLAAHKGNLVRLTLFWPGHGREGGELPYQKVDEKRYDLTKWNPAYWKRLRGFLSECQKRDVIVNLEIFDHPAVKGWDGRWPMHPFNPDNNVNYDGRAITTRDGSRQFFWTLPSHQKRPVVLEHQQRLVDKLLEETWQFGNIIYSLGNEDPSPREWSLHWARRIHAFGRKKGVRLLVTNMSPQYVLEEKEFDVFDAQVTLRVSPLRQPPIIARLLKYRKPVYSSGLGIRSDDSQTRDNLWIKFITGCAGARYHRVKGHYRDARRNYEETSDFVLNLQKFVDDVRFWRLDVRHADVKADIPAFCLSEAGKEYAIYLLRRKRSAEKRPEQITINLAKGRYDLRWYHPDKGRYEPNQRVTSEGRPVTLKSPPFAWDIAGHIKARR